MVKRVMKAQFSGVRTVSITVVEGENVYVAECVYKPSAKISATSKEVATDGGEQHGE